MKTTIINLFLSTLILGLSTGCSTFSNSQSRSLELDFSEVEEGIDIEQNPWEAIQKVIELGKNINNISEKIINQESVEAISFKDLIEYLPETPLGWTADKPQGETNSWASYSISQVSQAYTRDSKQIKVSIFDWAFNSALYTPFLLSTEFSRESTEGYNKGIKIGDIPGREEYSYASKQGSLNLLVNSRFLIQIDGTNIEDLELRKWWQLMDYSSLSKIGNKQSSNPNLR